MEATSVSSGRSMTKEDTVYVCVYTQECAHTLKKKKKNLKYYSAIKKNKILSFATKWMDLENIILSEVRLRKANAI